MTRSLPSRAFSRVFAAVLTLAALPSSAASAPNAAWPFEANAGRYDARVAFVGRASTGSVFVTRDGKVVHSLRTGTDGGRWSIVEHVDGVGAPVAGTPARTNITSFVGGKRDVDTFDQVRFPAGRGITTELRMRDGGVERLFYVAPAASPDTIRVTLDGATNVRALKDGTLRVTAGNAELRLSKPAAWQEANGRRQPVDVAYRVSGNSYRFALGRYDRTRPLVIDPLLQSTYVGGTGSEGVFGMVVATDRVYVTGGTDGGFPGTAGGAQPAEAPGNGGVESDVYVAAYSRDLRTLIQATYFGGDGTDFGDALALAENGIYVAGTTDSTTLPGTTGSAVPTYSGTDVDGFVALLSRDLTTLQRATYFGGGARDSISGLALNATTLYAVGTTQSGAPTPIQGTAGAAQPALAGPADAFIAAFSRDLTTLTRATYLGGELNDGAGGNPVLTADSIYIVGTTDSHALPNTAGSLQPSVDPTDGSNNAYVSRLTLDLTTIVRSTYYGLLFSHESGRSIASGFGDLFISGRGPGSGLPGTAGGAQPTPGGGFGEAFVARITHDLSSVVNATYFGGSDSEEMSTENLAISADAVFITGWTVSTDLPGTADGIQPANADPDYADAYVARFNPTLTTLEQATYLGSSTHESSQSIAVANGIVYIAGTEDSASFPGATGGASETYAGGDSEGFIAAMTDDLLLIAPPPNVTISDVTLAEGNGGSTLFNFVVTLDNAPSANATVMVQTVPGTATSPADFLAIPPTTLTFTPFGPLTQTVTVQVVGDLVDEPNETFQVTLTNPSGLTIEDGSGLGTITNDDAAAGAGAADVPSLSPFALALLGSVLAAAALIALRR